MNSGVIYFIFACRLIIILGTAYLVFWKGFSGWWFLLALVLCEMFGFTTKDEKP